MDVRSKLIKNVNIPIITIWKIPQESDDMKEVEFCKRFFESEAITPDIDEALSRAHPKNTPRSTICMYSFANEGNPSASIPPDL